MLLLDTDILINILRSYQPAIEWISSVEDIISITDFTAMELIQGCENKTELHKVQNTIEKFSILWLSTEGCNIALKAFIKLRLSHNIGLLDVIIAQIAIENNLQLHTFNIKHYKPIKNLVTSQPYQKDC